MTKRERVAAALKGEKVDRVPVTAWLHFPLQDKTAEGQVKAFVDLQETYDWDFMKLMFRSTFLLEDWGCRYSDYQRPLGFWIVDKHAVSSVQDWGKLKVLDPKAGVMGEMLSVVRMVKETMDAKEDVFKLGTCFVPFMVARQLSGDRIKQDIVDNPKAVHGALEVITETLKGFANALLDAGCDGLFYATQSARKGYMTVEQYREFGHPYNRQVLDAFSDRSQFTMMHICSDDVFFDEFLDYPVHAYNWEDRTTYPSLKEARKKTGKCLIGGIDKLGALRTGTPEAVIAEGRNSIRSIDSRGLILAPGCGIPMDVPAENLKAMRRAVDPQ